MPGAGTKRDVKTTLSDVKSILESEPGAGEIEGLQMMQKKPVA